MTSLFLPLLLTLSQAASEEKCVIAKPMPGAIYSEKDVRKQSELCEINFNDDKVALCPKTWSTSAATSVYGLAALDINQEKYESTYCKAKTTPKGVKKLAKFKQNMMAEHASAIWLKGIQSYFHLSRYLGTQVKVPVVVYREMNAQDHLERVSQFGPSRSLSNQNRVAWNWIVTAERDPKSAPASYGFFTSDLKNIRGVLYKDQGDRYGYEFIGSDDWGQAASDKYMATAPYRALRTDANLNSAIKAGLAVAGRTGKTSNLQMIRWMRDLTEIAVLDYILSQQDRFGNLDYVKKYVWVQDGAVHMRDFEEGMKGLEQFKPQIIQETQMGDNDASVHWSYTNFAKMHGYLNDLNHFSAKTYRRLFDLAADFKAQRTVANYLKSELGYNDKELARFEKQLNEVVDILKRQCEAKKLRFDLDEPNNYLLAGPKELQVDCAAP